ncbi:MAG: MFS transporter [Bacteroidetes bacterium]|nr:MFS transporter [Bacteroidota bacterium]
MDSGRRYGILASSLFMQLCLGATYAWSVFVAPLREHTGLSQATVQLPFTAFYFAFPLTMLFAGTLLQRFGPRVCAILGGTVFGCGWVLAFFGSQCFPLVVVGIGILSGVGVGIAYMVPIAVLVRWFPRHKGLVTGFAVVGFGGGAALLSQIAGRLISSGAYSPFETFGILGGAFFGIITLAGCFMQFPPSETQRLDAPIAFREILQRKEFRILYGCMTVALAGGFAVNANLKELHTGGAAEVGLIAVGVFAIANACGRLLWGFVFDRFASWSVIQANLIGQALLLLTAALWLNSETGFLIFAALAGLNYGGVLVLYASTVVRRWGAERVGQVYGLLFSANIVASPASMLAGVWFDVRGDFFLPLALLAAGMIVAAGFLRSSRASYP